MPLPTAIFTPPTAVPPRLVFRMATEADQSALHKNFHPQKPYPQFRNWYLKMMRWQKNGRCFWLIGEVDDRLIANGQLILYPHSAEIANLSVTPAQQNQGVGTGLLHVLFAIARHIGLDGLEIVVDVENKSAFALYERLGFIPDREVPLTGQETAVIMYKAMKTEP